MSEPATIGFRAAAMPEAQAGLAALKARYDHVSPDQADVIVALEAANIFGALHAFRDQVHRTSRALTKTGVKLASITAGDLYLKSNYQDFQRYPEVDVAIAAQDIGAGITNQDVVARSARGVVDPGAIGDRVALMIDVLHRDRAALGVEIGRAGR